MIKKITVLLLAFIILIIPLNVLASEVIGFTPYGEFFNTNTNTKKVCEILGMTDEQLEDYCNKSGIVYLAVDKENKKQIKISVTTNAFSESIVDISDMADEKIIEIIPQISGFDGVAGTVLEKNGQKFIRLDLKTEDSGGEYLLTQFITVEKKEKYILSFYTLSTEDTKYVEKSFENFYELSVFSKQKTQQQNTMLYVIAAAFILFLIISIAIIVSIVIDLTKRKEK